jgi:tetratricopeptide (TPR) repeat protein
LGAPALSQGEIVKPALFLIISAMAATLAAATWAQTGNRPDPLRQNASALEQQGRSSEAEAAWRTYLKTHPSDPEPYAHLGLLEARQEHYREAIPLYRKALAVNPSMPGLRLNLGLALFKNGDLKASISEFTPLLKDAPADSPQADRLTILLGMAHYGLGEYVQAMPFLKQAAARDPANLPLRLALAHSCLWSKQYQCAMEVYHEILALNAESAEADMLAGEALDELKDDTGSTKMFRAAVKANPKEPNVHFGLGYLLWTQKIYPEAASEFKAELANDPHNVQAMLYLADTDLQLNQPADARPIIDNVVKLDPSRSLAHLDLGIILSDAGENEDALHELTLAEKLDPNDVNVHWRLGRLYRTLGHKEEASTEFNKASTLHKAVDEELYKKMANGHAKGPPGAPAPAVSPDR